MNLLQKFKRWWQIQTGQQQTPFDDEVPFWVLSLVFHLVLLVVLSKLLIQPLVQKNVELAVEQLDEQFEEIDTAPEVDFSDNPTDDIGANSKNGFEAALSQASNFDDISKAEDDPEMEEREVGEIPIEQYIMDPVAPQIETIAVKGSVGVAAKGAEGAVDRITQEILLSLQERKTTVVWMFDQSASLLRQREEIVERFDRIYGQLGVLKEKGDKAFEKHKNSNSEAPLLTQIYAFGQNIGPMMKNPTDDVEKIKEVVRSIETDRSGIENVFQAVTLAVNDHKALRRINPSTGDRKRNVLLIIVSDEAGDDFQSLDSAVSNCKKYQVPVYVIGVPAPFGRKATFVKWVDPDPEFDQTPQWAPVSQGPESLFPERLRLNFSGAQRFEEESILDSGFGPFGLTRLCYETGGIYFTVHPNRKMNSRVRRRETEEYSAYFSHFFDPSIMRRYKPDYVTTETYMKKIRENQCRLALLQAAEQSWLNPMEPPQMRFEKLNEATFVNEVTQAQQAAAILEPKVLRLYNILKTGEQDREEEVSLRWKAGFDLAMGRVLAVKVRTSTYNQMLALAKSKLKFEDAKNNTWTLEAADEITTGSQARKEAERAKMYLQRVIDEHPNTPWAMLAEKELASPIGWKWQESFTQPPQPRMNRPGNNNNNNNARPMRAEKALKLAKPKKKRPAPKL